MFKPTRAHAVLRYVAANVRALRVARGMNQEQLAEAAGLHPSFVARVERAETNPTVRALVSFANALQVEPARLFVPATLKPSPPGRPRKR